MACYTIRCQPHRQSHRSRTVFKDNMAVVHPTVLLSIVVYYNRIAKDTKKRVVGVLLGMYGDNGILDITNCYAVPYEEDL